MVSLMKVFLKVNMINDVILLFLRIFDEDRRITNKVKKITAVVLDYGGDWYSGGVDYSAADSSAARKLARSSTWKF